MFLSRKADSEETLANIGTVPSGVAKFKEKTRKQLFKELDTVQRGMEKFANINKKALEEYQDLINNQTMLQEQRAKLTQEEDSIKSLLEYLDFKRWNFTLTTCKLVARTFEKMFKRLVPDGKGTLTFKNATAAESSQMDSDTPASAEERDAATMKEYVGVDIEVSFSSNQQQRSIAQDLSGGQKTIAALAFIFAIQRIDKTPFYLFDEIDAALDPQYGRAVAKLIKEEAGNTQFILTTFKPELVEVSDVCYGVVMKNKCSKMAPVSIERAKDFVENDETTEGRKETAAAAGEAMEVDEEMA